MNRIDSNDESLGRLLAQAGASIDSRAACELVAGVAAAPPGFSPEAWMDLVVVDADTALRQHLRSLLDDARAALDVPQPDPDVRLEDLRRELKRRRLSAFVVPRADEHQGEYVARQAERLAWLTGFAGSAGAAIVAADRAALFVDGRYTVQAREQADCDLFEVRHLTEEPAEDWIADAVPDGGRLGYDPWLHTPAQLATLRKGCKRAGARLVPVRDNPIDAVWVARPPAPIAPVVAYAEGLSGVSSREKRRRMAETLERDGDDAAVISAPDSIAWLLNLRGGDIPFTPIFLAFAIVHADASVEVFVDSRKLLPGVSEGLGDEVCFLSPEGFEVALARLGEAGLAVRVDPQATPVAIIERLKKAGADVTHGADPCAIPKSIKSAAELDGVRSAHLRDGAAVVRFLAWLADEAPKGELTETAAAARLEAFRSEGERFRGLSFETISAAGPHGAIVHYRVRPDTDRPLEPGSLYLVDSGAQYLDGTTDVTRTIAIGDPSIEMRQNFTRVLKGHIAIATARFPKGTTGSQLDILARVALWDAGLDYDHGTGHGVGAYLGVHEGPQRISKISNRVALEPGMVVSNEPGYYREDAYGIRIENLVAVVAVDSVEGAEKDLFGFETLTLAPVDRSLVDVAMLTTKEVEWLDAYHDRVRGALASMVPAEARDWLVGATRPVGMV